MELGAHIEALRGDPTSGEAADAVRSTARRDGEFRAYAEAFAERGESLWARGKHDAALDAWVEAALVCEENLGDLARAAQLYERALEIDPTHRRALFALGLVLYDLQRWDDLVHLYRRRMELTEDEGERTTLLQYVAELLAEKKDDPHGAFDALMTAAARAPRNVRNLSRLERLGEVTGRLPEVAIAIGDVLIHQEDPRLRAALSLRLAEMYLGPLEEPARALAHLRSALADDGGNPEVLGEIEDVFREQARFDDLAAFLEEALEDRRIEPHRVRLERELARIYELELNDGPRALQALTRALEIVPEDRELLDEVMRLGMAGGDLGAVAATYEQVVTATENPLLITYLRLKLGHLYENVLDQPQHARRTYAALLALEPGHEEAQRRLERLDGSVPPAGSHPGSVEIDDLTGDFDAPPSTPAEESPCGVVAASRDDAVLAGEVDIIDASVVDADDEVIDAVDEALALVAEVERIRQLQASERPDQSEPSPLARLEASAEELPVVRGRAPGSFVARVRAGIATTQASEAPPRARSVDADASASASPVRPGSRFAPPRPAPRLAGPGESPLALEEQVAGLEGAERAERRALAARAWVEAGSVERAEDLLRHGLVERAGDRGLLSTLADLLESTQRWREWMEVADRLRETLTEPREESQLTLRMAAVAKDHLQDVALAWELASALPADHVSLDLLERLARSAGDPEALRQVLLTRAQSYPEDPDALMAAGLGLREIGRVDEALPILTMAAELRPEHRGGAWALAEALTEVDDVGALAAWRRLADAGTAPERALAEVRWAEVRRGRSGGPEGAAADAVARALELDPDCRAAQALAYTLAIESGDPVRALHHAHRSAELESEPTARAAWWRRIAHVADLELGDVRRTLDALRRALELDPDDPESEARLGTILSERGEPAAAHLHLLRAARGLRDDDRAAELFEAAGAAAEASADEAAAVEAYDAALDRAATRRVALTRALVLCGRRGDLFRAADRAALLILHHESSLTDAERAACFSSMARGKQACGEHVAAARLARRASEATPDDLEILELLADTLEANEEGEAAVEVLRRVAARRPAGSGRAEALARAAALGRRASLADRARRVALLEEAIREAPTRIDIAESLADARLDAGDRAGAVAALEHAAAQTSDGERAALLVRAAYTVGREDRAEVRRLLGRAVAAAPGYADAVDGLATVLALDGAHESRFELLVAAAESAAEPERTRWRADAARIAECRLERPDRALALGSEMEPQRRADLLFRRALDDGQGLDTARRVWAQRCAARPGDRLALARLGMLHLRAGALGPARFTFELAAAMFGDALPPDAPSAVAPTEALEVPHDPAEHGEEAALLACLGYAPLAGLIDELEGPRPRRRDAVGLAALGVRVSRPLEEAARALGRALPPIFVVPEAAIVSPAWAAGAAALFVNPAGCEAIDETTLRFRFGCALAQLRPEILALRLLPAEFLRSAAHALAGIEPAPGDPVPAKLGRRRARAIERQLEPETRLEAAALARAWVGQPHRRSLIEASAAALRSAERSGLIASGSPLVAIDVVGDRPLDRARLLEFAFDARALGAPREPGELQVPV